MRAAVLYPSLRGVTTFTGSGWTAGGPPSVLGDLRNIRRAAVSIGATVSITASFASAQAVSAIALLHHNAVGGEGYSIDFGGGDVVSGSFPAWSPRSPGVLPLAVSPRTVSALTINLSGAATSWVLGGVDLGAFWFLGNVAADQQRGYAPTTQRVAQNGGGDVMTRSWAPRTFKGSLNPVLRPDLETKAVDFQAAFGLTDPFVWVRDIDDPGVWQREAFLTRNASLDQGSADQDVAGTLPLDLAEHLG